jgi:pimeloyl-ACP methyl ester carboxylesterase
VEITMSEPTHRIVEANGIPMHVAEQGADNRSLPWLSWVLVFLEAPARRAGGGWFHAVAPDMRGYGQTDAPEEIDRYTLLHLARSNETPGFHI